MNDKNSPLRKSAEVSEGVRIAVIDNGVNEAMLKKPLSHRVFVNEDGECVFDDMDIGQIDFRHGTTCAMIIETHFPEGEISSIRVLDANGTGMLDNLEPALEWCLIHGIHLINLSLGSTHFKDKNKMRALINKYSHQGMLIIAATSNNGYVSYPASFSNVVGVSVDRNPVISFIENEYLGIDVVVTDDQKLMMQGDSLMTQKSNSYAAPYVTALIGRYYAGLDRPVLKEALRVLQSAAKEQGLHIMRSHLRPDWISAALDETEGPKNRAQYYFSVWEKNRDDREDRINREVFDTVIVDDLSVVDRWLKKNKNIVYLGKDNYRGQAEAGCLFWSSQNRSDEICSYTYDTSQVEFGIPVILCEFEDTLAPVDEIVILDGLKHHFKEEGYHILAASFLVDGVLYDLEYIPEEVLEKQSQMISFLYWQTYYMQCDGLLIGTREKPGEKIACLRDKADLSVKIKKRDFTYTFDFIGGEYDSISVAAGEIHRDTIRTVFQKLKDILE